MMLDHNPRCRKSREGVQYLTEKGVLFEIVEYMKEEISEIKMKLLLNKLNITAIQLIRKNEKVWKEKFKDKKLTELLLLIFYILDYDKFLFYALDNSASIFCICM
jgi:arsenate reductase